MCDWDLKGYTAEYAVSAENEQLAALGFCQSSLVSTWLLARPQSFSLRTPRSLRFFYCEVADGKRVFNFLSPPSLLIPPSP